MKILRQKIIEILSKEIPAILTEMSFLETIPKEKGHHQGFSKSQVVSNNIGIIADQIIALIEDVPYKPPEKSKPEEWEDIILLVIEKIKDEINDNIYEIGDLPKISKERFGMIIRTLLLKERQKAFLQGVAEGEKNLQEMLGEEREKIIGEKELKLVEEIEKDLTLSEINNGYLVIKRIKSKIK